MENNLSLHLKLFNDKVKQMNQNGGKQLVLSAAEARNLHSDLFDLLNKFAVFSKQNAKDMQITTVELDGGKF